jgi:2-alkenal reductase
MKAKIRNRFVILVVILALFAVSCSQSSPSATAPVPIDIGVVEDALADVSEAGSELVSTSAPVEEALPSVAQSAVTVSDLESRLVNLYAQANPAVVYIITMVDSVPLGTGSGFVYDTLGHVVTNNHVVADGNRFEVVFPSGARSRAEIVGVDADADLAVIHLDDMPVGVSPLPLGNFADVEVGQFSIAIGNPFGQQNSMSLGIISGLGRSLPGEFDPRTLGSYSLPQVIQTDAPINPGNSGGPLLNLDGQVIGVNAAIRSDTGVNSGVGFSIPVAAVQRIVPELIKSGEYNYPYMGVSVAPEIGLDLQEAYGLAQATGAYLLSLTEGGPADIAGLRAADQARRGGDIIVKLGNREIRDFSDLNSYLVFETEPGQTITVTVLRDGNLVELPLTLGARP